MKTLKKFFFKLITSFIVALCLVITACDIFVPPGSDIENNDIAVKIICEGEDAVTFGNGSEAGLNDNCSNGGILANMSASAQAYAEYKVHVNNEGFANAYVKMAYIREETDMSKVIRFSVNGEMVDLTAKPVYPTCSDYQTFYEFPLGKVFLKKGDNDVVITSLGGGFDIDYLSFCTEKSFTENEVILEAENFSTVGKAYPVTDSKANGKRVLKSVNNSKMTASVISEKDLLADMILHIKSKNTNETFVDELFSLSVNGKSIYLGNIRLIRDQATGGFYANLGKILVKSGENKIVIENKNATIFYDYIELEQKGTKYNQDLTVSVQEAAINNGCYLRNKIVVNNVATSSVNFVINANELINAELSLFIKYDGQEKVLNNILYVTLNGRLFDLSKVQLSNNHTTFTEYSLGMICLQKGENLISITSISGDYEVSSIDVEVTD